MHHDDFSTVVAVAYRTLRFPLVAHRPDCLSGSHPDKFVFSQEPSRCRCLLVNTLNTMYYMYYLIL